MSVKSKIQAAIDLTTMKFYKNKPPLKVMSIEETLRLIAEKKLSVSRFGDGELLMMSNQMNKSFQTYDKLLAKKLMNVAKSSMDNHIVCIGSLFEGLSNYNEYARNFYTYFLGRKKYLFYKYFSTDRTYGNAFITRCYLDLIDKSQSPKYFDLLKEIWKDKDIVFIEGEFSRLGVGNDLFDNAKSVRRILAPAKNAYLQYDNIMAEARKIEKNALILIALGATATCLSYDLAKEGYWAIDCGHVDIEYEWMRMGATEKVPVPSKYVNEAGEEGAAVGKIEDKKYHSEIIAKINTVY